jgi:hypothetical protein
MGVEKEEDERKQREKDRKILQSTLKQNFKYKTMRTNVRASLYGSHSPPRTQAFGANSQNHLDGEHSGPGAIGNRHGNSIAGATMFLQNDQVTEKHKY